MTQKFKPKSAEKRTVTLYTRVKKENKKFVEAEAKKANISVSAYLDQAIDHLRA